MINPCARNNWFGYRLMYKGKPIAIITERICPRPDEEGYERLAVNVYDVPGDNVLFAVRVDELRHPGLAIRLNNLVKGKKELVWVPSGGSKEIMRRNAIERSEQTVSV